MQFMSKSKELRDIFDPDKRDEVVKSQGEYIDILKEMYGRMIVLQGQDEINALPDLHTLIEFMQQLLSLDDIMSIFNKFADISNCLMDVIFKDLSGLILKVGLFPTQEVLESTAKFLELHMQICMKVIHRGYSTFMKTVEHTLASGKRNFFLSNNSKCDPYMYPFGDKLANNFDHQAWVHNLQIGEEVDAVKFCKNECRAIWSRATVTEIEGYKVYVKFMNDNNKTYQHRGVSMTPFMINKFKTRSLDFEWRENLDKGDFVDIYLGRKGWLYFEIVESHLNENPESGEKIKTISCNLADYGDDIYSSDEEKNQFDLVVNVHDPLLRKGRQFSNKRFVNMEYCFDDVYEVGHEDMFAVCRGRFETSQTRKDTFINSKFLIRFFNIFCIDGGLDILKERLAQGVDANSAEFVGFFMAIIEAITPYLLNRTVEKYGQGILDKVKEFMLNSPLDILKTFSADIIKNVYSGYTVLAKRIYSTEQAAALHENLFLEISINCVKTDYLERKINGVTFLGDIYKNIKSKDYTIVDKKMLVKAIEEENIIEQIIKGHPSLIVKSSELMKLMFEDNKMSEKHMGLIWGTMRKGDLETKNSLLNILNNIYYDLSYKNMEFFINQIADVDPKYLVPDEIELAFKIVNFSKYKADNPGTKESNSLASSGVKIFWKVASSPDISNPDLVKKAIEKMISLLKTNNDERLEKDLVIEAVQNVKRSVAVIQSLKIIRKVITLHEKPNAELIELVINENVVSHAFASFKKMKADFKNTGMKAGTALTDAAANQLLNDKNYNFEAHVQKRLAFIDFVLQNAQPSNQTTIAMINTIWDELVEDLVVESEAHYFKVWFTQVCGNSVKKIVSSDILLEFFTEKVKMLLKPRQGGYKKDILLIFTELFMKLNILANNIEIVSIRLENEHSFSNRDEYVALKSPENMLGIQALWDIVLKGKDDNIAKEVANFITAGLYTRPELDKVDRNDGYIDYMKELIDKVIYLIREEEKKEGFETDKDAQRVIGLLLSMLSDFIDTSESREIVKNVSLSSFYKGKNGVMTIENKISPTFNTPKSIDIKVAGNTTVQQIKQMVSKEIKKTTWKNVKLLKGYRKVEIPDKCNTRNVRDLGISLGDRIYSEYRSAPVLKQEPLLLGDMTNTYINPKAIKAFKRIFYTYAKDARLGPEQLVKYTEVVLDEKNLSVDYHQIRDLLGKYDKDRKGYLSESDFLTFYTEACFSKANAVLGNLRNLNYNEQLLPVDENYEPEPEELARDYIMQQHEFVSDLYNMTEKIPSLAELSWGILSRLPPLPSIIKRITSLAGAQDAQDTNWDAILESQSTFKTLYNLFIVDFLLEDTQIEGEDNPLDGLIQEDSASFKKKWRHDFIIRGGFQYLFNVLKKYISQGTASQHDTLLLSFILRSVKTYLLASVTLLKPDIYPCVAFIGSSSTDFTTLINLKKQRLQTVPEGKQASTSTAPLESTAVAVGPPTKEEATKQDKQAEALKETAEFIDFREDFRQTSDHGIKSINVEETVRFLVRLCETVLSKTENLHFEELAIVEISLNIIFCCILDDLDLLRRLTSTNEIHLLSDNSSFRQAGYSDFLSFMIAGMLNKRGALIVKYFDNAFKVLLHEAESKEVQTVLVKVVFENSLKEGLPLRNTSKHIELAAQLLENICSEQKDAKILLSKSDLNTLVDLDTLFFEIFERVFRVKAQSRDELYYEIELLSNSFKILEKVLTIEPSLKKKLVEKEVIQRLFSDCLFNSPEGEEEKKELVCKSYFARSAAFELLAEACKGCPQNMLALYRKGLQKLSENLPKINAWGYTANTSRKSDLGFVGIHNPSCICYMNAMLQQFYMTPAFRYGILMADDAQAPDMVEVEEKVFDDNVFHQLQRMFAFLDKSDRRDYSPIEFCLSYKDFAGQRVDIRVQQDTKEFLDVIFDKLENALKPSPFKNLLFDVYGGKQISEIECSNCGNTRTNEQVFYNLSLEVKNLKNINEGIEKLITEDYISDYKCEACQKKCDVIKRTFLKECPNVLIVHLQRIIFDLDVLMNVKINSWYEFQNKMDLKNYTWENYVSNKPGAAKDAEEASTEKTDETDLKYQDSDINPNITEDPPQAAPQKPTESFEYNLAGVIVHLGSADMGHYYSYININRGDPGRPKIVEDRWLEFNDSRIANFKLSDLEEECFGSKEDTTFTRFDDDYESFFPGKGGKFSIDKCAYILVYEKVQKTPINITFTKENIHEKEMVLKNIKDEKINDLKLEVKDNGEEHLQIDFYDLKAYVPPKLQNLIKDDNFKFSIEQHVYSKEFLNFICNLSEFKELGDFNPYALPTKIYTQPVDPEFKAMLGSCLDANLLFLMDVFTKTEDNQSICKFSDNINRIVSVCHEKAMPILRHTIYGNLKAIIHILTDCPDANVRTAISDMVGHMILVSIASTNTVIHEADASSSEESESEISDEDIIKHVLKKLLALFKKDKKDTTYKKLKGFYRMWAYVIKNSSEILLWLVKENRFIERILNFYNDKKPSPYEQKNGFSEHEQAVEPLLKILHYCANFVKRHNETSIAAEMEEEIIDEECLNGLMFLEFYEKILGENYYFNNYKAMKDLIKTFCTNNLRLSKKIASCCFKNLTHYQENIFSYLEAIKELVLIEDQISSIRRDAIFGFPTLLDMKDFWKKVKYGFQVHKDLTLSAIKYRSPLNFNTNPTCLLKLVYENFEKKDNNCLIYLVYLLDMMLENKEVFKQIVELPSPFHLYANFCDWFIHFAAWYEKDKTISTHSIYGVSKAVLYEEPFKLKLDAFKEKYLEFIEENYPDAPTDKFKILADDSADKNWNFPIFPLSNTLIVGCAKTEELEKEVTIYEGDSDYISIKVSQLSVLAVPSVPTGHTNLSLPTCFRKKHTVYTTSLPKGCGLQKFFDCDEENSDKGRDNEYSVGQSLRQQETGGSKRTPGVVLNIPLNHITGDYDDDDETYPSNTGSTKQATELGSTLSDDKASAKEPASEVFNEEYDMRYFKTNYVLKLAVTNHTSSNIAFSFRILPKEKTNLYIPTSEFNLNVKENKKNHPVLFLMKKDPELPFGEFTLQVLFREMADHEHYYGANDLEFDDDAQPHQIDFLIPESQTDEILKSSQHRLQKEEPEQ